jgi:factor associated with neutral sphingomyelinase activation
MLHGQHSYVYSVDYGRVVDSVLAHDDALSCMDMSDDVLVSGSWDSTLKVWKVLPSGIDKVAIADFVDNDSEINCVAIHSHLIASGAADGTGLDCSSA